MYLEKGKAVELTMSCNSGSQLVAKPVIKARASLSEAYLFAIIARTAKRKSCDPSFVIKASKSRRRRCDGMCSKAVVKLRSSSDVPDTTSRF